MITCNKESFSACYQELKPLFLDQYAENEPDFKYELDVDHEAYTELDEKGFLHVYVARDGDGSLVGYLFVILGFHLHHRGLIYAISDIFYVTPEYRRSSVGTDLIRYAEKILKQEGVGMFYISMKIKQQFRSLLGGLGFTPAEEIWEKTI